MKRRTIPILMCVLLGVVTNLVVVLCIAYFPPDDLNVALTSMQTWNDREHDRFWTVTIRERTGITNIRTDGLARGTGLGNDGQAAAFDFPHGLPSWSQFHDVTLRASDGDRLIIDDFAMGWPMRSNRFYGVWSIHEANLNKSKQYTRGAWTYPTAAEYLNYGAHLAMPLIPIWPGFLFNTLLYALIHAVMWFGCCSASEQRGACYAASGGGV